MLAALVYVYWLSTDFTSQLLMGQALQHFCCKRGFHTPCMGPEMSIPSFPCFRSLHFLQSLNREQVKVKGRSGPSGNGKETLYLNGRMG